MAGQLAGNWLSLRESETRDAWIHRPRRLAECRPERRLPRERAGRDAPVGLALDLPDRDLHPDHGDGYDDEEQHEAARPETGYILEIAESDRQDEAAEAAHHADDPADSTDMGGIIHGYMLVD